MHRSGTSCLAGSLERCGLFLGDVRRTGRFNARGYYELKAVERIHDQILGLNHAAWHCPPERVLVHPYHRRVLKEVADRLSLHRPCGLKDPRLLLLLETWLDVVATPYTLVGTFRHPVAVAQSLARRNGIGEAGALDLWLRYNRALIRFHRARHFPIVEFSLTDTDSYCRTIAELAQSLHLTPRLSKLRRFVDCKLEHHHQANTPVPPKCLEEYDYLQHHCHRSADTATER